MKQYTFLWMSALMVLAVSICSCSNDDEPESELNSELNPKSEVYESNPTTLNGIWHMVSADYGMGGTYTYPAGEITVTFNEAEKTMKVEDKKNTSSFLKSGNYTYTTTTEKSRIYTYQWVDVEYRVIVIQYSDEAFGQREVKYTYGFNDGMLLLDDGMAYDGPGYFFKKLAN